MDREESNITDILNKARIDVDEMKAIQFVGLNSLLYDFDYVTIFAGDVEKDLICHVYVTPNTDKPVMCETPVLSGGLGGSISDATTIYRDDKVWEFAIACQQRTTDSSEDEILVRWLGDATMTYRLEDA